MPPRISRPPSIVSWKPFQKWLARSAPPTVPPLMISSLTEAPLTQPNVLAVRWSTVAPALTVSRPRIVPVEPPLPSSSSPPLTVVPPVKVL